MPVKPNWDTPKFNVYRMMRSINFFSGKFPQANGYLVANPSKDRRDLILAACSFGGVVKTPVDPLGRAGEDRTRLVGVIADGNYVVELGIEEFVEAFRPVAGNVDPDLGHRRDRLRTDKTGDGTGTFDLETVAGNIAKKPFGHLAACGISRAKDKDSFHKKGKSVKVKKGKSEKGGFAN